MVRRTLLNEKQALWYDFTEQTTKKKYSLIGYYISFKKHGTVGGSEMTLMRMKNGRELAIHGEMNSPLRSTKANTKEMWTQLVENYGFKRVV